MAENTGGRVLGHEEALTELIEWSGGGTGAGSLLLLTGPAQDTKGLLLDRLTARIGGAAAWLRVTPDGRVRASSGDAARMLAAAERRATDFAGGADDGGGADLIVVDDLRGVQAGGGDLARTLGTIVIAAAGRGWDGPRIVAGVGIVPPRFQDVPAIEPALVQSRHRALDETTAWVQDRNAPPVLLVRGRPGAGKTFFLREAARHFASLAGVRPAYVSLRDGAVPGDPPRPLTTQAVVAGFIEAFREQRLVFSVPENGGLHIRQETGTVHPGGRVTGIERVEVASSLHTYGNLALALEQRAAGGWADPTLVLVVDALNELEGELPEELAALRTFLQHRQEFPTWNLKVVVASQYTPGWLRARILDLDDHGDDVHEFATTVLTGLGLADAEAVAEQVTRLAEGLFIVADGYLSELAADPSLAGRLAAEAPAGGAAAYFVRALDRVADAVRGTSGEQDWIDFERLLTIAAITGPGPTAAEAKAIWDTPLDDRLPPPTSRDWSFVASRGPDSPARGYLRFPQDTGGRYRVFHSTVREAAGRRRARHEAISADSERRRFLRALTPLYPGGRPWDPVDGRLALSETVPVIGDLLASASGDPKRPDVTGDPAVRAEAEAALKLLLETWTWLETCVAHPEPPSPGGLPLGIETVLARLDRLPGSADLPLWDGDDEPVLPARTPKPVPTGRRPRPREPRLAYPDSDRELEKVVKGRSIHPRRADAEKVVADFKERYRFSAKVVDEKNPGRRALWIHGFQLTREEMEKGYTGNMAWIDVLRHGRSSWRVEVRKVEVPLELHPTTPKLLYAHPNWSVHPLPVAENTIRSSSKPPRLFATRSDAERVVRDFVKRYKSGRIWGQEFGVIVLEGRRPRWVLLKVVQRPDGQFVIRVEQNPRDPNLKGGGGDRDRGSAQGGVGTAAP
ncbi:hypothetical protein [Actinomadura sp. 6K520]|uniref:hypothetical protein n=1 Tax=Actinomadura sp. 6K520 TaxID=2530364 RepID=UPI00104602FD|nr:hypothetical protein [Actinomadura sp. 6K520]TDE27417.1 hypothetical protein E1289_23220 [Actinomadura sp. 6K520]